MKRGIVIALIYIFYFYGLNHLFHMMLPKYWDVLVGFPLSIYLMWEALEVYASYLDLKDSRICRHLETTETFRYYPDLYRICKCDKCGEEIFETI